MVSVEDLVNNLMNDHDVIKVSVSIVDKMLAEKLLDPSDINMLLDFYEFFVDKCHHVKEEVILFPSINIKLYPFENSPVNVMVMDHGIFRYLIRLNRELLSRLINGDQSIKDTLMDYLALMTGHLNQHMEKEDKVLFPQAMDLDNVESSRSIEDIEAEVDHDKWLQVIEKLKVKYLSID
ncbi:hemerythrin domain-containing protein [Caldivirga maquilingensis]|uniref:Hemerythrin HHE cation binding domain protein n=1 Tax=Caldivirga maquilingensis (strain ATCC 700844 / DSM 13496 / JCM 10307 / IC-167) TaxID=397948 RepID=A8MAV0_CALMQ|nr:hemerythrin domain-containing protein [Caldivirga maquilingensis]ABW01136.1 Hemerythrin HHE cation binding domain protein [Caldivirga maquilingensis IC-167]